MKVLFLIGNAAVGKMTVGQELMKISDLRLFLAADVVAYKINEQFNL